MPRVRRRCGTSWGASATPWTIAKLRRFRYSVQVNSPGPDRGAAREQHHARIVLEALGVTLSKDARTR